MDARNQGGLLDVALDPNFATNEFIYWSYAEPREGGVNNTAVARGTLVDRPAPQVENVQVIYHQTPTLNSTLHFGSRLVFGRDGILFVTQGERSVTEGRMQAQRTLAHRNIQAAALHPTTGVLSEVEHGTRGGDEINVARKGKDYGWPTIAYGIEYRGGADYRRHHCQGRQGATDRLRDPVIGPSGMAFYTGNLFPAWKGATSSAGIKQPISCG